MDCEKCGEFYEDGKMCPKCQPESSQKMGVKKGCALGCLSIVVILIFLIWLGSRSSEVDSAWTKLPITAQSISEHVTIGEKFRVQDITSGSIYIVIDQKDFWNQTSLVHTVGRDHIQLCKQLFAHPGVREVITAAETTLTDPYGKQSTDIVALLTWTRDVHGHIDYDNFRNLDTGEQAYRVAVRYKLHPDIWRHYETPEKLQYQRIKND